MGADEDDNNSKRSDSSLSGRDDHNYSDKTYVELEEDLLDEVLSEEKKTYRGISVSNSDKISE
mgnify:CR=1 FL=1